MAAETPQRSLEEQIRRMTPVSAPPEQRSDAAALFRLLDRASRARGQRGVCKLVGPTGEAIPIPDSVFYVLERVVEVMARGDSIFWDHEIEAPEGEAPTRENLTRLSSSFSQFLAGLVPIRNENAPTASAPRGVLVKANLRFLEEQRRKGNLRG